MTRRRAVKHRSRQRWAAFAALLFALFVVWVLIALNNQHLPPLTAQRVLGPYVRFGGPSPKLDWPTQGQSAVEVLGVGSLGTSGAQTPVPIASVAKVMTAYLTIEEHPLRAGQNGFQMTITAEDVRQERERAALGESVLAVRSGEVLSERQALEALMLPSANNIAALLAEYDAGSQSAFVARMNSTAARLGMSSTTYDDPSGYDANTTSTATDQLKLARVAMRKPSFAEIAKQSSADLPVAGEVDNYNSLLGEDGYVGIKTGSDRAAGGCLIFAKRITVVGRRLMVLGVVLGQREGSLIPAALSSARRLGDSAASAIHLGTLLAAHTRVLTVTGTDGQRTDILTSSPLRQVGWGGLRVAVSVKSVLRGSTLRSAQQTATVSLGGPIKVTVSALAEHQIASPSLGWRLSHLL